MSTVYCRGCGKETHETAETCPSCGAPQNIVGDKHKVVAALLAFFTGSLGIHRFYLGQSINKLVLPQLLPEKTLSWQLKMGVLPGCVVIKSKTQFY